MMSARCSEKPGADEKRAQRVCRLHRQHRIPGRTLKTANGILMQRSKLHPFNRAEICYKPISLANGAN